MEHTMTLYVADRKINEFMRHFDLKPDHKWYIKPVEVSFATEAPVNDDYFAMLIRESKKQEEKWIPAIRYMNNLYADESVKELSDGDKVFFV